MREVDFDKYEINSDGSILSKRYRKDITKTTVNKYGYPIVKLACKDGGYITKLVHRIIAEKFIPNPSGLKTVNHIDFDKTNNDIDNLEWMTTKENCVHYTSSTDRWVSTAKDRLHDESEFVSLERINNRSLITYECRICNSQYKTRLDSSVVPRGLCKTCSKKKSKGDSSARY